PLSRTGMMFLLLATISSLAGILCCRRFPDPECAEMDPGLRALLVGVYGTRLLCACFIMFLDAAPYFYLSEESLWKEWYFWASLWPRWAMELLLFVILSRYGREIGSKQIPFLLKCMVACMAAEFVIQIVVVLSSSDWGQARLASS